jgi:hypothetical protein
MSKSIRKSSNRGFCLALSEKKDKKRWHKTFRRKIHIEMKNTNIEEFDNLPYIHIKEISLSSPWIMSKDGKWYFGYYKNDFRLSDWKDHTYHMIYEDLMRK